MAGARTVLFPRGSSLAVIAGDDDEERFWLCRASQVVYDDLSSFAVHWFDRSEVDKKTMKPVGTDLFKNTFQKGRVEIESVLCKVKLYSVRKKGGGTLRGVLELAPWEKKKVDSAFERVDEGKGRDFEKLIKNNGGDDDDGDESSSDEGYNDENGEEASSSSSEEDEEEEEVKKPAPRKKAPVKRKKVAPAAKAPAVKTKKIAAKKTSKAAGKKKDAKKTKPKAPPGKKPPNWKLKPNSAVTEWDEDPLFEGDEEVPFVSTSAHSRLVFRAVLRRDNALLKSCIADKKRVFSLDVARSMAEEESPLECAARTGNLEACRLLSSSRDKKARQQRAHPPECLLETTGTGTYNMRSLGLRRVRRLNMSRGNREGNNAFTKDQDQIRAGNGGGSSADAVALIKRGASLAVLRELSKMKILGRESHFWMVAKAVRWGRNELAAHFVEQEMREQQLGTSFGKYHHEALCTDGKKWDHNLREVSVRKKSGWGGMTPMHFACANPDVGALKKLYAVCPEVNMADQRQRKPAHYAAACAGTAPLEFLAANGANLEDVDRKGNTPLMRAAKAGRVDNVRLIIAAIKKKRGDCDPDSPLFKKMGPGGVNVANRESKTAVHMAVKEGRLDVVRVLHEAGANLEKPLSANMEKRTPLMIAAARGDLQMVKFLADKVKVSATDSYKRTALTHAVMNGAAAVASFLLRMGMDPDARDSSGNADLHYAAAYGWYFCARALVEAGADLKSANEWKLTPVAVAFLKGHVGLSKYLLSLPGVDVDFRNDAGKTTLLVLVSQAVAGLDKKPLTGGMFSEVKELVEKRGADATLRDYSGEGVLHHLCRYSTRPGEDQERKRKHQAKHGTFSACPPEPDATFKKRWDSNRAQRTKFVRFFVGKGCSFLQADKEGYLPIMRLMEVRENDMGRKDYGMIREILQLMIKEVRARLAGASFAGDDGCYAIGDGKPGLLNAWTANVSLVHIEEEREVFSLIKEFTDKLVGKDKAGKSVKFTVSPSFEAMVEARDAQAKPAYTPFLMLCRSYSASKNFKKENVTNTDNHAVVYEGVQWSPKKDGGIASLADKWRAFKDLVVDFESHYGPKVAISVPAEHTSRAGFITRGEEPVSAACLLADAPGEPDEVAGAAFRAVVDLEIDGHRDDPDLRGRSPLVNAVLADKNRMARLLAMDGGFDVNFCYDSDKKLVLASGERVRLRSCPLYDAIERGNLELVKLFMELGARMVGEEMYSEDRDGERHRRKFQLVAVVSCMKNRCDKDRRKVLKELVEAGMDLEVTDFRGRNPLHLAVNSVAAEGADESLDLELILMRSGVDANAKDDLDRIPLHYAFTKTGKRDDFGRCDPIEVVSMLVEAMGGEGEENAEVDVADAYGATPLHYAAQRGSTASCLLLLQCGADINRTDARGNTPLAYAVLGKHEGCAMTLLQRGATVDVTVKNVASSESAREARKKATKFKFLNEHFDAGKEAEDFTLFQGIIANNWLGISHLALRSFEASGLTFARAVEVAFRMQKLQFAKNLLGKQVSERKLREKVTCGRDLLTCMAFECRADAQKDLQSDIVELVTEDKPVLKADDRGCTAVHYACMNHNSALLRELSRFSDFSDWIDDNDNDFAVAPISALFWNSPKTKASDAAAPASSHSSIGLFGSPKPSDENDKEEDRFGEQNACLAILLEAGADADVTFRSRKIDVVRSEYALETKALKDFELTDEPAITPLIAAVSHLNHEAVEMLLARGTALHPLDGGRPADVNLADSAGRTALMHAVKTNDYDSVVQLLNENGRKATKEDYGRKKGDLVKSGVKVDAVDGEGYGVLHHVIETVRSPKATYDNKQIFDLLVRAGCDPKKDVVSPDTGRSKMTTLQLAQELGASEIAKSVRAGSAIKRSLEAPSVDDPMDGEWEWEEADVVADARAMLDILEKEAEEEERREKKGDEDMDTDMDDEDEDKKYGVIKDELVDKPSECTAGEGARLHAGRAAVMTKIDVRYGAWGMYNFYKMQVWKEQHKDLWVLLTHWGRIGHHQGQYQNTPFGSAEQAEAEFDKIFKAKTGNEWAERDRFERKPGKYRMVESDHLRKVRRRKVRFDLSSEVPTTLPRPLASLMADLADVSVYVKVYSQLGPDVEAIPFGSIKRETLLEARDLLQQLEKLIKRQRGLTQAVAKLRRKTKQGHVLEAQIKSKEEAEHKVAEEIFKLTSEYYYRVPQSGMEYVKLPVIDQPWVLLQQMGIVDTMLSLETTERLLLGAMYRRREINPLDYIYRALGCAVRPLDPSDEPVSKILQYMYNYSDAAEQAVEAVYEIGCSAEAGTLGQELAAACKGADRRLLWHGTKATNLLSILSTGLKAAPMNAVHSGQSHGVGVYTSDSFGKSWNYTMDWTSERDSKTSRYMLLCDVALGKLYDQGKNNRYPEAYPPRGYDSYCTSPDMIPDPLCTLRVHGGLDLPLGPRVPKEGDKARRIGVSSWHFSAHSHAEFVTYKDTQTSLRYLLKIRNTDLHGDDDDEEEEEDDDRVGEEVDSGEDEKEDDEGPARKRPRKAFRGRGTVYRGRAFARKRMVPVPKMRASPKKARAAFAFA